MPNKIHRILFVVDGIRLREFKRSVEDYSKTWEVDFASSGPEALDHLVEQPFDAVIVALGNPAGTDGIELLSMVGEQTPEVIRFALSGNSSDVQVLKFAQLVHQMIPATSSMGAIYEIVERACLMRDLLADPDLLRVITGITALPSVPVLYTKLFKELQTEEANTKKVGEIIAQDAAMTAKILQMVNSAFFGLSDHISSPQRAVALLGLNTIKALVLGVQVFSEFQGSKGLPTTVDALWNHSMLVSSLAASIAKKLKLSAQEREDVRVAGVLHDIGILLYFKMPYLTPSSFFSENGHISVDGEMQLFGTSHAEMGGYLLGIWGLPNTIVEAVAFHHAPWQQVAPSPSIIDVLYTATGLVDLCQYESEKKYSAYLDTDYLRQTGMTEYLDEWLGMAKDLMGKAGLLH
jgi:HD-like signal output (HDOD) protein